VHVCVCVCVYRRCVYVCVSRSLLCVRVCMCVYDVYMYVCMCVYVYMSNGKYKGTWLSSINGANNLIRKEFLLQETPSKASLFISGVGYYEVYINGAKVGHSKLDVGWTTYANRVLYASYDITDVLVKGVNAIGVMMGRGWYVCVFVVCLLCFVCVI